MTTSGVFESMELTDLEYFWVCGFGGAETRKEVIAAFLFACFPFVPELGFVDGSGTCSSSFGTCSVSSTSWKSVILEVFFIAASAFSTAEVRDEASVAADEELSPPPPAVEEGAADEASTPSLEVEEGMMTSTASRRRGRSTSAKVQSSELRIRPKINKFRS
ncbi:uncharacterized protein LOC121053320 [Oryza brachyantha]|uniref:uncharacterized protein LOC121053320 n=1 Tax=Oryza brachyantha TaxID=4533 RepID=UPI001ADB48ED|nr:uncharacterized protein LOC121053320 [Oryza brachyantha]